MSIGRFLERGKKDLTLCRVGLVISDWSVPAVWISSDCASAGTLVLFQAFARDCYVLGDLLSTAIQLLHCARQEIKSYFSHAKPELLIAIARHFKTFPILVYRMSHSG
jgi:hypothetical protein